MLVSTMDHVKLLESLLDKNYSPKSQYPTNMVQAKKKAQPLNGGKSKKIGGISSPKFYELLVKKELKGNTDLDLENFYNHINICLNAVTRLREDLSWLPVH